MLKDLDIDPGLALDLTTVDELGNLWDFDKKHMREKARARLNAQKPVLLIGSPMCKASSQLQRESSRR